MLEHLPRFELSLDDADYPDLLREAPHPPPVLYGIGDPVSLKPAVGMVGARRATPYGLAAARLLAGWAGGAGFVVVSGGALGCDQAAHVAALEAGGRTVAVLGGGADVCYPSRCERLFERIASKGAVVSEQPWGTGPRPWMFRRRNRIIAGLCRVLVVLEAGLPSGTFSTAEYALDASRLVAAVPGSIFAPECRGSNRLIASGAPPINDVSELATLLGTESIFDEVRRTKDVAAEDEVYRALVADPMRPDDLARALGLDVVTVARRLGVLEAEGRIARYPNGRYGVR